MATATKHKRVPNPRSNGRVTHQYILNGQIRLPAHFSNLAAFRRWCMSSEYPERGDVFWIDGDIWVSDEMEDYSTHNAVKTEFVVVLGRLVKTKKLGIMFSDRMRLVHPRASLSVEPDAMFVSNERIASKRVRMKPNKKNRILEVVGSPDMVLEATSDSSVPKDERLEEKYFAAGVREYWRVDARGEELRFDILKRGKTAFEPVLSDHGYLKSEVFERSFALSMEIGELGIAEFTLDVM